MQLLIQNSLNLLPNDLVKKAQDMSQAYQYMYCLENLLRIYVDEHPSRNSIRIPTNCQKLIIGRKIAGGNLKWASSRGHSDIYYLDFKDLQALFIGNWQYFDKDFPSLNWITAKLEDLTHCRNLIAHNSDLGSQELELIKLHFNLITRQLGINEVKPNREVPKINSSINPFIEGLDSSAIFSYPDACKGVDFTLKYPGEIDVAPLLLKIYFLQIGLNFQVLFSNAKTSLFPKFKACMRKDMPEERQLSSTTYIQVGQHDIDGDGLGELFICARDYTINQHSEGIDVNIFKYFPPMYRQHTYRAANWEQIGDFTYTNILGEPKAFISGNSIKAPRNLRGFFYRHTYTEGKFRDTGEW